jgi:hypothetical protein
MGLGHADVVTAILREALTRPRCDVPLPVPDFTSPPAQVAEPLSLTGRLPVR